MIVKTLAVLIRATVSTFYVYGVSSEGIVISTYDPSSGDTHPGPFDFTFKTTTPWMTKTMNYFKDKGR